MSNVVMLHLRVLPISLSKANSCTASTIIRSSTTTTSKRWDILSRFQLSIPRTFSSSSSSSSTSSTNTNKTTITDRDQIKGPHGNYLSEYTKSITNPTEFWYEASKQLHWFTPPSEEHVLTSQTKSSPSPSPSSSSSSAAAADADVIEHPGLQQWFADGQINISYNCLDLHIQQGRGEQPALLYDSPPTSTKKTYTYNELHDQVSKFAYILHTKYNVTKGDRVVIYMPMIPEAIIAMLACTRIGAVHSVVFGGFASNELASRIIDCRPKVVISANGGIEPNRIVEYKPLLDDALDIVTKHNHAQKHDNDNGNDNGNDDIQCIIVRRKAINNGECQMTQGRDEDYDEIMDQNKHKIDAIPLPSTHPHYILYTSGTTGKPKGVLRDTGSHATALKYSMDAFYNTSPGDVFWAASDIGWVVGHSYIVYGPLLQGCTTVLYEGKPVGTPDAGAYWRVVEEYNVKTLFTAPTAIRAIKQADPKGELAKGYNLEGLESLFLAGERSDPGTLKYCENVLKDYNIPVIDHWWQTELGWPAIGNAIGLGHIPTKYGACAAAVPGFDLSIFDDVGSSVPNGILGNLAIKLPLPPGSLFGLYKNNERYIKDYLSPLEGYYTTGDSAIIDDEGYVHIMARTDDIINTAGHRLSTGAMEEILLGHPEVADCAVIGVNDEIKGHVPVGFVVTNTNTSMDDGELCKQLIDRVRNDLGPVASFRKVAVVNKLPKTRSGKILRGTMTKIANDEEWTMTPTIEDPTVFDSLGPIIKSLVVQ